MSSLWSLKCFCRFHQEDSDYQHYQVDWQKKVTVQSKQFLLSTVLLYLYKHVGCHTYIYFYWLMFINFCFALAALDDINSYGIGTSVSNIRKRSPNLSLSSLRSVFNIQQVSISLFHSFASFIIQYFNFLLRSLHLWHRRSFLSTFFTLLFANVLARHELSQTNLEVDTLSK